MLHSKAKEVNRWNRLDHWATRDPLTGLYSRPHFYKLLHNTLLAVKHPSDAVALLLFDLDRFRDINESFGHRAGDEVLRLIACRLEAGLHNKAILARFGGDEFAVLLPQTDLQAAREVGRNLLRLLGNRPISVANRHIYLRVSAGVAVYPHHADSAESLLVGAERGMYTAKSGGGNRLEVGASSGPSRKLAEERLYWELKIAEALRNDGFTLYWQPILDLRRNRVVGYELLLRMKDREGRVIEPDSFLRIAERSGQIFAIDRWVVRQAIEYLSSFLCDQPEVHALHVNLSANAFCDDQLLEMLLQELKRLPLDPSRLVLEITESTAIADPGRAQVFIDALRAVGCRFALDDFGVGFSAFDRLRYLPVDFLKIDGRFVRDAVHNPVDRHLVRAMVEMSRALDLHTIAENIPDQQTIELLIEYGVDYGQGFYIGRPQPAPIALKR